MDYSKLSKKELYRIATDHLVKMSERYDAVRELQKRKGVMDDDGRN